MCYKKETELKQNVKLKSLDVLSAIKPKTKTKPQFIGTQHLYLILVLWQI